MANALSRTGFVRRLVATSWIQPETLNVAPHLLGRPLAPHGRRALAIALDVVIVGLLSSAGAFWIAAAIAALVFQLRRRPPERRLWLWLALALMVFVAAQRTIAFVERRADRAQAAATGQARTIEIDGDPDDAEDGADAASAPISAPASSTAASGAGDSDPRVMAHLVARVAQLEAEVAEAHKPPIARWRDDLARSARAIGLGFGWAIAYFTLLPFWLAGQTIGKKVFGLRIVELTGRPLTLMTCFGRYAGYAAGMATGGAGFLQVLWDPNRQAIQDKLAHTVVVDERPNGRNQHEVA